MAKRDDFFPGNPDGRRVMAQLVRSIQIVLRLDPWGVFVEDYLGSQTCKLIIICMMLLNQLKHFDEVT